MVIDNGSGLSRDTRISAHTLARLLLHAWSSPVMPELASSLPVTGLDGTLRRSRAQLGRAHLKTGSLRDVAGVAGYVLGSSGRRYVLVAIDQSPERERGARRRSTRWCSGRAPTTTARAPWYPVPLRSGPDRRRSERVVARARVGRSAELPVTGGAHCTIGPKPRIAVGAGDQRLRRAVGQRGSRTRRW